MGVSRSATLVIAWLMKTRKLSFYQAFKQVQAKRAQILPNIGFASQLQLFEHELLGRGEEDEPSSLARYLHQVCNTPVEIETLQAALARNDYDAVASLRMIFGEDIPVQRPTSSSPPMASMHPFSRCRSSLKYDQVLITRHS